jgi:hypothetical protein
MSNTAYTPGNGNLPFGLRNTNPQSSNYSTDSVYSPEESNLIAKEIKRTIFDAAPAQYNALKLLFEKPFVEKGSDEFEYLETTFGRSPLEANGNVSAEAASPGAYVTQTITLTAASVERCSPDQIIIYEDGTHGIISAITGNDITVNSYKSQGLPAVTSGDMFAIMSTIEADGNNEFSNYERMDVVTRYNYVGRVLRCRST